MTGIIFFQSDLKTVYPYTYIVTSTKSSINAFSILMKVRYLARHLTQEIKLLYIKTVNLL